MIGLVFVLLFGTKKIPELGKGLGKGIKTFKAAIKGPSPEKPAEVAAEVVAEERPAGKVRYRPVFTAAPVEYTGSNPP